MSRISPLRVAIVNDYEMVVAGLALMLAPYADRVEVVELDVNLPVSSPVDVVLFDTFAQARGARIDRAAILATSEAKLVVFTWSAEPHLAESVAGDVDGYLLKGTPAEDLVAALEKIHAGERVIQGIPTRYTVHPGDWPGREAGLSERQAQIIALITQGLSNDEVAARSFLSINTVKSYIRSSYRKMGVNSRSQAVLWGLEHGFRTQQERITLDGDEP